MSKYKKISKNLQQVVLNNPKTNREKLLWLNINNAGKKEIEYLRKNYKFNLNHLRASSAKIIAQRPSFIYDEEHHYIFIILHFPILKNGRIVAGEVDFFIKSGVLISMHNNDLPQLNEFFNYCKKDGDSLISYKYESAGILLYELLNKLIGNCYDLLDRNSIKITEIEGLIFDHRKQKKAVSRILNLRRNIINFRKIIQNHKNIFKKQMARKSELVPPEIMKKYYSELIEYTKTIWEILDNQKEMIEVLNDTNESLLNNRLNDIIKTLTIFSVIVFPLTLFAALFGMNTLGGMPFLKTENGFWIVVSAMAAGSVGMLIFFKRKKWL